MITLLLWSILLAILIAAAREVLEFVLWVKGIRPIQREYSKQVRRSTSTRFLKAKEG